MKKKRRRPMSAAEHEAELANDPAYQTMLREKEARRAAIAAKNRQEEAGLVKELQEAGVRIVMEPAPWEPDGYEGPPRSISELVNTNSLYPKAIPLLVRHLQMDYSLNIKKSIVRALAVPEARGIAFEPLVEEFCRIDDPDSEYKWIIGAAIAQTATPETVPTVLELIRDKRHGKAREEIPLALLNLPADEAETLLEPLTNDSDLAKCATEGLKRIRRRRRPSA